METAVLVVAPEPPASTPARDPAAVAFAVAAPPVDRAAEVFAMAVAVADSAMAVAPVAAVAASVTPAAVAVFETAVAPVVAVAEEVNEAAAGIAMAAVGGRSVVMNVAAEIDDHPRATQIGIGIPKKTEPLSFERASASIRRFFIRGLAPLFFLPVQRRQLGSRRIDPLPCSYAT